MRSCPRPGNAIRVGITGAPGAGKSTFIEALGMQRVEAGDKLAVLAVDPSSTRTGGSILGDKTRMERLAREERAFIRPSPSGGTLGWRRAPHREAMLVCEAAACDVVIVETVGVGQSEVAVAGMVDLFVLLLAPGGGDELQGVKRGIVELADLLVVNKADGDLEAAARRTATDYASALHIGHSGEGAVAVLTASAFTGAGVPRCGTRSRGRRRRRGIRRERARRRAEQARAWMWSEVSDTLMERFRADPEVGVTLSTGSKPTWSRGGCRRRPRLRDCSTHSRLGLSSPSHCSPQLAFTLLASARLAPGVDGLGRLMPAQDLARLGDALAADGAGPLVERPLQTAGARGEQAELGGRLLLVRFGPGRHDRLAHNWSIPVG